MSQQRRGSTPCVYQMYDINGTLVYIGHAIDPARRFLQHRSSAEFWGAVATIELIHTTTLAEAQRIEYALIRAKQPIFNIVGSDEYTAR